MSLCIAHIECVSLTHFCCSFLNEKSNFVQYTQFISCGLQGFHKRRLQRQKKAREEAEDKARKERIQMRKEYRNELKSMIGETATTEADQNGTNAPIRLS